MSKLVMQQKVLKLLESYEIKKDNQVVYTAKKKLLAAGADFEIFDKQGNKVAYIDQKVINAVKTFNITINGQSAGTIKKQFPALTKDLDYNARGWKLDGDLLGMNFKFTDYTKQSHCNVSKKVLSFGDCYEIDAVDARDELLCIVLTIIIDEVFHSKRS